MDWTGPQLLQRLDAGAKLGAAVFAERGLDHSYTPIRLLRAATAYRCSGAVGSVLPTTVDAKHAIALSFNDGPSAYTPQVLHLLEHGHAHATFFVSGAQLAGLAVVTAPRSGVGVTVHRRIARLIGLLFTETERREIGRAHV